jgi:lipopolysaccharide/colanic/teichoic acid biosynthesis glycosyltransferase
MRVFPSVRTNVTVADDARITRLGRWLRSTKIDELPQFIHVLAGQMSVVGPRPDVEGYADRLEGADRVVLTVRPGITGPASVFYRDEEALLARQPDPERFNDVVLWPEKVRLNRDYVERYSFLEDLRLIADTALPGLTLSRAARLRAGAAAPDGSRLT